MPHSRPTNKDTKPGDRPQRSIQEQLDDLLVKIETAEPGTVDPNVLPGPFQAQQLRDSIAAKMNASKEEAPKAKANAPAPASEAPAQQAAEPHAAPAKPAPSDEQSAMLAALNAALQGMNPASKPGKPADAPTLAPPTIAHEPADEPDTEQLLQEEIAALLDNELDGTSQTSDASAAADEPATAQAAINENELSTEDQIALEIESLLNADQRDAPDPAQQSETSIDELDQLLASEIDADDELLGDFHTVQAITAGIQTAKKPTRSKDDVHAATARDVAAELDSQPEDLAHADRYQPDTDEDPFAALAEIAQVAEKNEKEYRQRVRLSLPVWVRRAQDARERLLAVCYILNWPARRFLTNEWRANLGYIALLNLFFGVGFWLYLIVR